MKRTNTRRSATESPQASTRGGAPLFPIVGIGASAGGMEAFVELLAQLPPDSGMAFVLIQHLDPTHPSYLREAISHATPIAVEEARDGTVVLPDHIYVIPSNADVGILHGALTLFPRPATKPHLPIDFFFRALAADRGTQAIAVVLSGTGSDGAEGLTAIKAEDGVTFVQTPESARFSGMPEAAIRTSQVDFVLPIHELGAELLRVGRHRFANGFVTAGAAHPDEDAELKKIVVLLRTASGVDFSEYKAASIRRRVVRRMSLHRVTSLLDYVRLLRDNRVELSNLFDDILIHVTSFFRDGDAYDALKVQAFPEILKKKRHGGTIRIWCAGCASGEEAYSLVIGLLEFLDAHDASDVPVQLFGTDVCERSIERARAGFYPDGIGRDLGSERLARFFTRTEGGGYTINKAVRDRCNFVKHDLARDPPFSKIDLISCRNVLIYFDQGLQKRVLSTFHYALSQPGFLMLGQAENIGDGSQLFFVVDKSQRIFGRTAAKSTLLFAPARDLAQAFAPAIAHVSTQADLVRRTERLLLEEYTPPGVIVNERMEILHFFGRTGPYLEPAPGQAHYDLLKMARKGLMAELSIAISRAKKEKGIVRRIGVHVEKEDTTIVCDVAVRSLSSPPDSREHVFLVLFEAGGAHASSAPLPPLGETPPPAGFEALAQVEDELKATKGYLQSIIEEQQRTNQELMSTHEEAVSSNEELQSLNEELGTAREELQSSNEELSTLNEELQTRNAELNLVNSDLINILGSVEVPMVIVDSNRRIRRFTPRARPILNLLPTDVGRPIDDIKPTVSISGLDQKIAEVIESLRVHEEEVQSRDGRWFRLQIRPCTTVDKRIDGAVLSIIDIDVLKRALGAAEWARDYAAATVEAIQVPLVMLDARLTVLSANEAFHAAYGLPRNESQGRSLHDILGGALDFPELRSALEQVLKTELRFQKLEVERDVPGLGRRALSLSGGSAATPGGDRTVLLAAEDVTARRRGDRALIEAIKDAQSWFIVPGTSLEIFDNLLHRLLDLTGSRYGFIDELVSAENDQPHFAGRAVTNVASNDATRQLYKQYLTGEVRFPRLDSLFATVVQRGAPVVIEGGSQDPARGELAKGHPALDAFLGLPLRSGQELVGVVGLANAPGGYGEATVAYLEPLVRACANIMAALKNDERRKKADHEVRRLLESENRRIAEASRLKSEFVANMSHELRTPLNSIIGFAELLHDGEVGPVSAKQREFLDDILTSGKHLLHLISDVLDLSKVEAGKLDLQPEPIELAEVVAEVVSILRTPAAAKTIRVETSVPADIGRVVMDPSRLKQVLYNYLSNAMKFTPEHGTVTVRVRDEPPGAIRVEVEDTGIGISDADLARLFAAFQQVDSSAAKAHSGTGLGLALTKRLVEAQGGSVGASSTVGKGSLFYAVLPRTADKRPSALPRSPM